MTRADRQGDPGRLTRLWRAFTNPYFDTGPYATPRPLRFIDWIAKLAAVPWFGLLAWVIYALAVQIFESIPDAYHAESRRAYFYALGLTITGLGALLVAPLVLMRTFINERQAQAVEEQRRIQQEQREIAEHTHFTTLYSRAIEQLGANTTARVNDEEKTVPAIEVRIGAIYALERIAKQSDSDYRPVVETLCAYVRLHSGPVIENDRPDIPYPENLEAEDAEARRERMDAISSRATAISIDGKQIREEVAAKRHQKYAERPDIRAALDVLIRRPKDRRELEHHSTEKPPGLQDVQVFDHVSTVSSSGEPLSGEEVFARVMQKLQEEYPQLIERRLENIAEFKARLNAWKQPKCDGAWAPDLAGAVLQGLRRAETDFRHMDLQGAQMEGAELHGAQMQGANLEGARMDGALLSGADMRGANLQRARMDGASLMGAVMDGADFLGARMQGADLPVAWMGGVDLDGVRAEGANFAGAHMEGAYLGGARLEGANFRGADLEGAQMGKAKAQRRLVQIGFAGAAHLTPNEFREDARFIRAMSLRPMFAAANLTGARLEGADLRAVRMDEAILQDADMSFASLKNADLSRTQGLAQDQVDAAFGDGSVLLPDGIDRPGHWCPENLDDDAYYGRYRNWVRSQRRPWPYAPVFGYWENVESIPFDRPAQSNEIQDRNESSIDR